MEQWAAVGQAYVRGGWVYQFEFENYLISYLTLFGVSCVRSVTASVTRTLGFRLVVTSTSIQIPTA